MRRVAVWTGNPVRVIIRPRIISHPYLSGSRRNSSLVRRLFLIDEVFVICFIALRGAFLSQHRLSREPQVIELMRPCLRYSPDVSRPHTITLFSLLLIIPWRRNQRDLHWLLGAHTGVLRQLQLVAQPDATIAAPAM